MFPDNWATLPLSFGLIMCKDNPQQPPISFTNLSKSSLGWTWCLPEYLQRHETSEKVPEESHDYILIYSTII